MDSCSKHVQFIHKHCIENNSLWNGKVCEIGSGNSKLLYSLENNNYLNKGIGIEISPSRHEFAEKFKEYVNSKKVTNVNENIFNYKHLYDFDLVIGVDLVLQLIAPIYRNSEKFIFDWINQSLKGKGYLLLELWDFEHILKQIELFENNLKIWEDFPESDPWEFCLANIKKNKVSDIIWEKQFLKRNSLERSSFTNILRPYSREKIKAILERNGFNCITEFNHWVSDEDTQKGEYIILAQTTI